MSEVAGAASGKLPDKTEIRKYVVKTNTEKLQQELAHGQDVFLIEDIKQFSRPKLVEQVVQLRFIVGTANPVQQLCTGFSPVDIEEDEVVFSSVGEGSRSVGHTPARLGLRSSSVSTLEHTHQQVTLDTSTLNIGAHTTVAQDTSIQNTATNTTGTSNTVTQSTTANATVAMSDLALLLQHMTEQARQAAEQSRLDREAADRRAAEQIRLASEQTRLATEAAENRARLDREAMLTQFASMSRNNEQAGTSRSDSNDRRTEDPTSYSSRLEKASKICRFLLFAMPDNKAEIVTYLSEIDRIFNANNIDVDLRISLLTMHVNRHVRMLMTNMREDERNDYELFKARLIAEHALSPATHKAAFDDAKRREAESVQQYCSRTKNLLMTYLKSKSVTTFDQLVNLLLLEKIKSNLTHRAKFVVTEREALKPGYTVEDACGVLEILEVEQGFSYVNFTPGKPTTFKSNWKPNNNSYTNGNQYQNSKQNSSYQPQNQTNNQSQRQDQQNTRHPFQKADKSQIRCHKCSKLGHLQRDCRSTNTGERPKRVQRVCNKGKRSRNHSGGSNQPPTDVKRVQLTTQLYNTDRVTSDKLTQDIEVPPVADKDFLSLDCGAGSVLAMADGGADIDSR